MLVCKNVAEERAKVIRIRRVITKTVNQSIQDLLLTGTRGEGERKKEGCVNKCEFNNFPVNFLLSDERGERV